MATGRHHWSHCARPAKFFVINASAAVPWLALALMPGWTLLWIALTLSAALIYIEIMKKMTVNAFLRACIIQLTGRTKTTQTIQ